MRSAVIGATRVLLLIGMAVSPIIVAAQLNPTVKVLKRPGAVVPAECTEALAPQEAQRVTPEERTIVRDTSRDMLPPPSRSLRGELEAAVGAAQQSRRDAFRESLGRAKELLVSYPPGGERTAASDVINALDDVNAVWDYEFSSPTGAFFDTSSDIYRIATRYPGYEASVRRQIITDQNGNRFYPSRETRDFLVGEAAQRLSRLTGRPAAPRPAIRGTVIPERRDTTTSRTTTTTSRPTATTPRTSPRPAVTTTSRQSSTTKHARRTTQHATRRSPVVREARAAEKPHVPPRSTSTAAPPPPSSRPAATTTTAPEPVATTTTAQSAGAPSTTSTYPTDTMSTAEPATSSTTTTSTAATTASADTAKGQQPAQSRSFFGPIILIIVGLGVLVMLWRASS